MKASVPVLWLVVAAAGQVPAAGQPGPLAITGATLVNPDRSPPLESAVILIAANRIAAVGPAGEVRVPDGARVLDARGKWVVPGLIDAHVHFFQSGDLYTRPDVIDLRSHVPYEKEIARLRQNLPDTFARYLRCGITGVADVGGPFWNFEVRERARRAAAAPRVAVTGPLISTYQPAALTTDDPPILRVTTPEAARALVRREVPRRPDYIKIWYIVRRGETAAEHRPVVEAAIQESHRHGLRVAVHATELETARAAVDAGCDLLVHSVFDREVDDEFVALLKRRRVIYITTLMVRQRYLETFTQKLRLTPAEHALANPYVIATLFDLRHLPAADLSPRQRALLENPPPVAEPTVAIENLRRLHRAGVTIAMGTDAGNIGTPHGPAIFREFELMRKAGLTPREVLRAATVGGARVMGREKDLGLVRPGRLADLVVLDADPLADLANLARVHRVVKDGRVFRPAELLAQTPADLVQRQVNAYNARDLAAFAATCSAEVELYRLGEKKPFLRGGAALEKHYAEDFARTPRLHCRILKRIEQGSYVIHHEEVTGRKDGTIRTVAIYEVAGGLIRRVWFAR